MSRKLRLRYVQFGDCEHAMIETAKGYYFCTVERCGGEGQRSFRLRARSIKQALERYNGPILTTSPDEC